MRAYRDKNNNLHSTKQSLNEANTKIDAEHVLRTFFMMNDEERSIALQQITSEHVNALARHILLRDKNKKAATEAVAEERKESF